MSIEVGSIVIEDGKTYRVTEYRVEEIDGVTVVVVTIAPIEGEQPPEQPPQ